MNCLHIVYILFTYTFQLMISENIKNTENNLIITQTPLNGRILLIVRQEAKIKEALT